VSAPAIAYEDFLKTKGARFDGEQTGIGVSF
jgi:hypothetical protein